MRYAPVTKRGFAADAAPATTGCGAPRGRAPIRGGYGLFLNALSTLRLAFIPVFALSIWQGHMLSAAIILVLASVTDFLDGVIARAFNQRSRLGRLLDPAADRLYIATALIMLAVVGALPWLVVVLLLARDVILAVHVPIFCALRVCSYFR